MNLTVRYSLLLGSTVGYPRDSLVSCFIYWHSDYKCSTANMVQLY